MALWGALLSLAGQGLAQGLSKINNDNADREREDYYETQSANIRAKKNENQLSRSDVRRVIGQYDREAQRQIENADNVAKITGATPEYSLAIQQGLAEGRADLMGNLQAGASERADKADAELKQIEAQQAAAQREYRAQRNEQFANLAGNAASTFGSMVDAAVGSSSAPQRKTATANSQNEEKKATGTAAAKSSAQYYAAAQRTNNPYERNVLQQTGAAAKQQEQLATGTAVTTTPPIDSDPEPDRSDFFAHAQWAARHSNPYRSR